MDRLEDTMSGLYLIANNTVDIQIEPITGPSETSGEMKTDAEFDRQASDAGNAGEEVYEEETLEGDVINEDSESAVEGDYIDPGVSDEEFIMDPGFVDGGYIDDGYIDPGYIDGGYIDGGYIDYGTETGMGEVKDPLLSSWPFVIGISAAVLVVSIVIGVLLAKLKIKKGIDLYED
jgi:hypothetical protein